MKDIENVFTSVVVPSVNGSRAKLLFISETRFKKFKKFTELNKKEKAKPYALMSKSTINHKLLNDYACLTEEQFSKFLRKIYNSKVTYSKNGKVLKVA